MLLVSGCTPLTSPSAGSGDLSRVSSPERDSAGRSSPALGGALLVACLARSPTTARERSGSIAPGGRPGQNAGVVVGVTLTIARNRVRPSALRSLSWGLIL